MTDNEREMFVEAIADLKSLAVVNGFLLQCVLEIVGMKPETILKTVESINTKTGDMFEAAMRTKLGMPRRTEPRQSVLSRIEELAELRSIDWSKIDPQ